MQHTEASRHPERRSSPVPGAMAVSALGLQGDARGAGAGLALQGSWGPAGQGLQLARETADPCVSNPRVAHEMGRGRRAFAGYTCRGRPGLGPAWTCVGLSTGQGLGAPHRPRGSHIPRLGPERPAAFRGAHSGRLCSRSPPVRCPPWTGCSVSISWWWAWYRRWTDDVSVGAPQRTHGNSLQPTPEAWDGAWD